MAPEHAPSAPPPAPLSSGWGGAAFIAARDMLSPSSPTVRPWAAWPSAGRLTRRVRAYGTRALLVGALAFFSACPHPDTITDPAPPTAAPGCVLYPPPEWLPVDVLDPPECAGEDVAGCLDVDAAIRLRRQIEELRTWAAVTWARCAE